MRCPGMTPKRYHRALPGASIKSCTLTGEPSSGNAFGHESLSRELTTHAETAVTVGVTTLTDTKSPGLMPATETPKYPDGSVVTGTGFPTGTPPASTPATQLRLDVACSVIGRFDAPTTRPIKNALVPPVAIALMSVGASVGKSMPLRTCSVLGNEMRCGF